MVRFSDARFYKIGPILEWLNPNWLPNHSKTGQIGPVFKRSKAKRLPFCFYHLKPDKFVWFLNGKSKILAT
jgi:hypothetical protein